MKNLKKKHAPGPWKVITRPNSCICSIVEDQEDFVSIVDSCSETHAALIAAAPEMLHALEHLEKEIEIADGGYIKHSPGAVNKIKSAIRKAKGEL